MSLLAAEFHFHSPSLQGARADSQSQWDAHKVSIVGFHPSALISIIMKNLTSL